MKKSITFLGLLFFIYQFGYSQCDTKNCVFVNMDFKPNSAFVSNADWQASHGSPSVSQNSAWMWSYNNRGEGINYHSYNFVKGRTYSITANASTMVKDGATANSQAFFSIVATVNEVIGNVTSSSGGAIPVIPAPSQIIAVENWNGTNPPSTNNYTYTFTATHNFDNLWFYPSSPKLPQIELSLRKIAICDITPTPEVICSQLRMDFKPNSAFVSNADWQASHGSPSVSQNSAWMWSYNNRGEGINYHSYNFVKGRTYSITANASTMVKDGATANSQAFFSIVATVNEVIGNVTSSSGGAIPVIPAPSQIIAVENWNGTNPPSTNNYTYTFTATHNFDNLWFYPSSPKLPQIELNLRKIVICDITPTPKSISSRSRIDNIEPFPEELKVKNQLNTFDKIGAKIAPNPSANIFAIALEGESTIENIEIYNLTSGKLVHPIETTVASSRTINMSSEKAGIYTIKITLMSGAVIFKKVVLNK